MTRKYIPLLKAEAFERGFCEICASWRFGECYARRGLDTDNPRCGLSGKGVELFKKRLEDLEKYGKNRRKRVRKEAQTPQGQGLLR